jgi:hypothetical protein
MLRKAAGTVVFVFVAAWIYHDPTGAGDSVRHWVNGTLLFFQHLS